MKAAFICVDCLLFWLFFQCPLMYLLTPSFVLTVFYSDYSFNVHWCICDRYINGHWKNNRNRRQSTQMKAWTDTSMDIERTIRIEDSQHKWRRRQIHQWTLKELSSILIVLSMSIDVSVDAFICVDCLLFWLFFQCPLMYLSTPSFVLTVFYSDCSFNVHWIGIEDSQHKWRCRQIHQWTLKEQSE
jgi:hypothetical protein